MSIREQERREREAMRKAGEVESRIERRMREADRQMNRAMLRAEEVKRRIEVGHVQPRPLPSLREDSVESIGSTGSMESMGSMKSMKSAKKLDETKGSEEDYSEGY